MGIDKNLDKNELYTFSSYYKNVFTYINKDKTKKVSFTTNYRTELCPIITIRFLINEGCENINVELLPKK